VVVDDVVLEGAVEVPVQASATRANSIIPGHSRFITE
jgi:hypothetical protein